MNRFPPRGVTLVALAIAVPAGASSGNPLTASNDGANGVTSAPLSATAPEPARLTMMGLGFAGLVAREVR